MKGPWELLSAIKVNKIPSAQTIAKEHQLDKLNTALSYEQMYQFPFTVCFSGNVKVVSGSRIEKTGKTCGFIKANFSFVSAQIERFLHLKP